MLANYLMRATGVATPPSYTFNAQSGDNNTRSTFTFTSVSFGTAAAGRLVVVFFSTANGQDSVTSATIGGVSATVGITQAGSSAVRITAVYAVVPTGTSGTVVINLTGTSSRGRMACFSIYDLSSTTPEDTDGTANSSNVSTNTLSVSKDAVVLAGIVHVDNGQSFVWSGVTEAYDTDNGFPGTHSGGGALAASTNATYSITSTRSADSRRAQIALAWR